MSGTVEEVERAVASSKPVHLYFSTATLPNNVDTRQLDGLRNFRAEISQRGLLRDFATTAQLRHEVWEVIEYDIAQLDLGVPVLQSVTRGVRFLAQPQQERGVKGFDNKGKPRYSNRHRIEVTNSGDKDSTDIIFESVGGESSMMLAGTETPTVIHTGQMQRINVFRHMGGGGPDILRIRWTENGESKDQDFHVG